MGLEADVRAGVTNVLAPEWNRRNGQVVPKSEDVTLKDGAVDIQATYLYADMADSTGLAQSYKDFAVAKAIRCYLDAASRLIRAAGGEIRSFDGDRVMGIFIGDNKNTNAVRAAMNISWAVEEVIGPALKGKWSDFNWVMRHGVGIDTGAAMIVRGGVRGNNDLVSIGSAPNIAAKLSDKRTGKSLHISKAVYDDLADLAKYSNGANMWTHLGSEVHGGKTIQTYGSNYRWTP